MNMGLKKQAHIQVTLKIINEPKLPFYQHAQEKKLLYSVNVTKRQKVKTT